MESVWSSRDAEQSVAPEQQNACKRNAGAENPVAQGTSEALRLPGSAAKSKEVLYRKEQA
ncbi:MAG TPA: hypothetical protein VJ999_01925 [Candidatus Sulfotelmatobacter sp.]|nr:hypothetical protein [Candidatus Sulfotelmatobacter sp.]